MTPTALYGASLPLIDCWNILGVRGDQSCPRLLQVVHCHNCDVFATAARGLLARSPPDGYLEEMAGLLAASEAFERPRDSLSVVVFELDRQALAIDTAAVVEVTEPREIHRLAHRTGRVFSGIVNIHGQLELCASLQGLLQTGGEASPAAEDSRDARMLLVERGDQRWVFAVDRVHGVERFAPGDVLGVPSTTRHDAASYLKKVLRWAEQGVGYLDLDRTFDALAVTLR